MIYKVEHKAWESEAVQWMGNNFDEIMEFTKSELKLENDTMVITSKIAYYKEDNSLALINPFGGHPFPLAIGDWIIRTREGNLGPCTNESFKNDFEIISGAKGEQVYKFSKEQLTKAVKYTAEELTRNISKHDINDALASVKFLKEESINDIANFKNSKLTHNLYELYFANFDRIEEVLNKMLELIQEVK